MGSASDEPLLFTVATTLTPNVVNMETTLAKTGWKYRVLALGEPWRGFRTKMAAYATAAAAEPPDRIVLCADSSDVLVFTTPARFAAQWHAYFPAARIVLSGVASCLPRNCPPGDAWLHGAPPRTSRWHINSGLIAGRAADVAAMFAWMLEAGSYDDQLGCGEYIDAERAAGRSIADYHVDVESRLFVNCDVGVPMQFEGGVGAFSDPDSFHIADENGVALEGRIVHFPGLGIGLHRLIGRVGLYERLGTAALQLEYLKPVVSAHHHMISGAIIWIIVMCTCWAAVAAAVHGVSAPVAIMVPSALLAGLYAMWQHAMRATAS